MWACPVLQFVRVKNERLLITIFHTQEDVLYVCVVCHVLVDDISLPGLSLYEYFTWLCINYGMDLQFHDD